MSKDQIISNQLNTQPVFDASNPRSLYNTHSNQVKKSMKLTIPKPIMHVPDSHQMFSNSSQDSEDAELSNIASIASRSGMATYNQNYDSQDSFGENEYRIPGDNGEFEPKPKKIVYTEIPHNERGTTVLKIKLVRFKTINLIFTYIYKFIYLFYCFQIIAFNFCRCNS